MKIEHLTNDRIDIKRWNNCIENSFNKTVYALSWFLDIVSPDWEALVADDYQSVMPLPAGKKYGISYILQPLFTQQLGVFTQGKLSENLIQQFLENIPSKYRLVSINLNKYNKISPARFRVTKGINHELELISPYAKLHHQYSTNIKRNLKKAEQAALVLYTNIQPNLLIDLIRDNVGQKLGSIKNGDYNTMRQIIAYAIAKGMGSIYGTMTKENTLCAAAFFLEYNRKAILLFNGSSDEGKKNNAMTLIIDHYIRSHSEKNLILDFEGSNIESLARFYKGFGANMSEYPKIHLNDLPWPLKHFARV